MRIRNGERELEVSGAPAFVRQVLDDLPTLMARLNGEVPSRSAVALPAPPAPAALIAPVATPVDGNGATAEHVNGGSAKPVAGRRARKTSPADVEGLVFDVLRGSEAPLAVAAIRKRLPAGATGQQVRRILERAENRVRVSGERPATYSLR